MQKSTPNWISYPCILVAVVLVLVSSITKLSAQSVQSAQSVSQNVDKPILPPHLS